MREPILALAFLGTVLGICAAQGCSSSTVRQRARELGTSGPSSKKAHQILLKDHTFGFPFPTIVVGVEKAPRVDLELAPKVHASGLRGSIPADGLCKPLLKERTRRLEDILNDRKRTFISHVAYFDAFDANPPLGDDNAPSEETGGTFLFNAYVECGATPIVGDLFDCNLSSYENSWLALDRIGRRVSELLQSGEFTHVLLIAKGWNTPQIRSLQFVKSMSHYLRLEAAESGHEFHPLVVAITWHSGWVWPWVGPSPLARGLSKLASFKNKADDADEIGLVWANHLLHRILPPSQNADAPVVLLGHSYGARLLSRAAASGDLLHDGEYRGSADMLVSLQGAFSMNRFIPERWRLPREGAPYYDLTKTVPHVFLTWSRHDGANPKAQIGTGANHVGGAPGHRRARAYPARFAFWEWDTSSGLVPASYLGKQEPGRWNSPLCSPPIGPPVGVIDASSIVHRHGDVDDHDAARLVWELIVRAGLARRAGPQHRDHPWRLGR